MNSIAIKALAAASLSLLAISPAAAEEVRVLVHHSDLDIASPAGADALAERIQIAVNTACRSADVRDLKAGAALSACRENATQNAVEQAAAKGAAVEGTSLALID